jgi:outer membrane protein TolC
MKNFIEIALKQYEVGMGIQADILRAQTELSTLKNEEINLQQQQIIISGMINTLMNHPVTEFLGMIAEIQPTVPRWAFNQLQAIALEHRPELSGMRFTIDMNVAELSLSKREYYPDLMTKLVYKNMTDTKDDFWSLMIGINFPLAFWSSNKYTSQVEENELRVAKAENDLNQMKNMVMYEVQTALVRWQSSYNTLQLYISTSIPQAEQTLQSTLTAYQTGKTEFLMVIDAYRILLMVKLDYQMSLMNYLTSLAQLEQAVGMEVENIEKYIHSSNTKEK